MASLLLLPLLLLLLLLLPLLPLRLWSQLRWLAEIFSVFSERKG